MNGPHVHVRLSPRRLMEDLKHLPLAVHDSPAATYPSALLASTLAATRSRDSSQSAQAITEDLETSGTIPVGIHPACDLASRSDLGKAAFEVAGLLQHLL
jgi:hypothetical protein